MLNFFSAPKLDNKWKYERYEFRSEPSIQPINPRSRVRIRHADLFDHFYALTRVERMQISISSQVSQKTTE